jgi:hypothetical protein
MLLCGETGFDDIGALELLFWVRSGAMVAVTMVCRVRFFFVTESNNSCTRVRGYHYMNISIGDSDCNIHLLFFYVSVLRPFVYIDQHHREQPAMPKRRVMLDHSRQQCWGPKLCPRHGRLLISDLKKCRKKE